MQCDDSMMHVSMMISVLRVGHSPTRSAYSPQCETDPSVFYSISGPSDSLKSRSIATRTLSPR